MTAPTPEQLRALADDVQSHLDNIRATRTRGQLPDDERVQLLVRSEAALRADADQLEAVRKLASARAATGRERRDIGTERSWNDVLVMLAGDTAPKDGDDWQLLSDALDARFADTAPQEDRDE